MKTLILFSTRDGQTREIASFLASELKELGIDADTLNLNRTDVVEWHHYDRVVIGASIRYGHFHPAVDRFVKKHLAALQALPGAFFSVNLVARKPSMLAIIATGVDDFSAFASVVATLNNLGPGLGVVADNFATMNPVAKWILIANMLFGRLEVFTLLVLFTPTFWRE
ncbi:hypothetical protein L7H87_01220 [Klebsiella pneumoniae]|nr:hypothetical protein L7H87_01220 [Klebsiella pneumoniae]